MDKVRRKDLWNTSNISTDHLEATCRKEERYREYTLCEHKLHFACTVVHVSVDYETVKTANTVYMIVLCNSFPRIHGNK